MLYGKIENAFCMPQKIGLGTLVRTGPECLFTGCSDPDGYDGYNPVRSNWDDEEMMHYEKRDGYLTDGTYKLYFDNRADFIFGGENDIDIALKLKPYEKRSFTFVFTRNEKAPKTYKEARKETSIRLRTYLFGIRKRDIILLHYRMQL